MRNEQTTIDDVESLRAAMAAGLHPSFLFFWGHTAKDANVGKHVLSQWWPAAFLINDQHYRTAEHYMMAEKARLFRDEACRAQIIDTESPAEVKALGREVRGFDEERWVESRFEIAGRGNIAKFSQNWSCETGLSAHRRPCSLKQAPWTPSGALG